MRDAQVPIDRREDSERSPYILAPINSFRSVPALHSPCCYCTSWIATVPRKCPLAKRASRAIAANRSPRIASSTFPYIGLSGKFVRLAFNSVRNAATHLRFHRLDFERTGFLRCLLSSGNGPSWNKARAVTFSCGCSTLSPRLLRVCKGNHI